MFWLLLLVAATTAAVYFRWQRRGMHKAHSEMPFDLPAYPIIGHAFMFRGTDEDRMNALKRVGRVAVRQGGLCSFWMGFKLYTVITDPESVELVARSCLEKDDATMKYIRMVIGNASIFAPVNIWRPRRKIMAPTFNMKNLQQFVKIFDRQSAIMGDLLRARAGRGDFSIWNYMTTYTFDAVCESTLGCEINSQAQSGHPFIAAFDGVTQILSKRMLSPWLYWDWIFKLTPYYRPFVDQMQFIHDFFDELIRQKRKQLARPSHDHSSGENGTKTFLDMLIESSGGASGYSDLELREEVMNIVMAGTDTSAVGSSFTALMLARHPDVQDKVYQELQDVFGDSDRAVTWEDLPKLKYLEMVIKETLRLYTPVPVIARDVHETVVLPSGPTLVPGTAVILHIWGSHRNTEYWGADADEFRPERFLSPLRHPAQYIPFSCSIRNCAGSTYAMMSMKTNLAHLLRRYTVLPPAGLGAAQLREPLRVKFDIMMKHVDNFVVRLEYRKKK